MLKLGQDCGALCRSGDRNGTTTRDTGIETVDRDEHVAAFRSVVDAHGEFFKSGPDRRGRSHPSAILDKRYSRDLQIHLSSVSRNATR